MRYLTQENKNRVTHIVEEYLKQDFQHLLSKRLDELSKISKTINLQQEGINGKITIDIKYEPV